LRKGSLCGAAKDIAIEYIMADECQVSPFIDGYVARDELPFTGFGFGAYSVIKTYRSRLDLGLIGYPVLPGTNNQD
jgi:hypothetical protein